jgi:excisionase family DNA binding protein
MAASRKTIPVHATPLLTVRQVAVRCNVCERTVSRWIDSRELPAHHLGRLVRVSEQDLAVFLAARRGL